mgnify:CR=1 FL=1
MSTTYYICKYTPVELLEAFGGECAILNHMPDNFELSDQVAHPNICGFGKSLLEACMEGKVKELVLVNCCDTIRSAYDVLLEYGKLDFLFLLDIMHSGGTCSREHAQHELRRLAEPTALTRGPASTPRVREAFRTRKRPTAPYISVLGARVATSFPADGKTCRCQCATTPASTIAPWPCQKSSTPILTPSWQITPAPCSVRSPACA